ncbi:MAG: CDP-diacylglycerol--glycerol-3-phosphate 3-phosphatidyltransferase [Gammaproteobacteria bacterium]|nr:MAG: CDP-diacylglycerol--glycerol-3-phosphate 3-phosphatidyltransferase [Gammaproteobacteria bacterium]
MTFANQLTLLRIILIPLFVVIFYLPFWWAHLSCAVIFAVAAVTDWLDGYVARKYNQSTAFGAFLDPVADKLMVAISLLLLVSIHHDSAWFVAAAAIIVGREIVISALREWMAELGQRASVAVSFIGKIKTTLQMISILLLLMDRQEWYLMEIGYLALAGAAALTLWSMVIYLRAAYPFFSIGSTKK